MSVVGVIKSRLADQRAVICDAGTTGLGITRQLRDDMVMPNNVSVAEANKAIYLLDRHGRAKESLGSNQAEFTHPDAEWADAQTDANGEVGLLEVVRKVKPTVLVGCSTRSRVFMEEVIREMAERVERPLIMSLSNPSKLVEVDPKDANEWTEGRALMAPGSPLPPCKQPTYAVVYLLLGFGAMITQARIMIDSMIIARHLASLAPALKESDLPLLPDLADAPEVNYEIAVAVAEQAIKEGSAGVDWRKEEAREKIRRAQWIPVYKAFIYDPAGAAGEQ